MKFEIERPDFIPYPMGKSEGIIYEIEDLGMQDTQFGPRHKICMKVESMTHQHPETGQPMTIHRRYNLSGHANSDLRRDRDLILGRQLTDKEAYKFDSEELIGKRIEYVVVHNTSPDGRTFGNIDSLWRHANQKKGTMTQAGREQRNDGGQPPSPNTAQVPEGQAVGANSDNLPF